MDMYADAWRTFVALAHSIGYYCTPATTTSTAMTPTSDADDGPSTTYVAHVLVTLLSFYLMDSVKYHWSVCRSEHLGVQVSQPDEGRRNL